MLAGRWKKMNVHRKRVFAAALAVAVASTSFNIASFAVNADSSKDGRVITAFRDLDSDVAYQYLPVGSFESDIVLPEELKVMVFSSDIDPEPEPEPTPEEPVPEKPSPEEPTPEEPAPEEPVPETPAPETPAPEDRVPEEPAPETPAPEEPVPENPAPEEPEAPAEPVPEKDGAPADGQGEGDLSAAIRNIFAAKTVFAAEGEEPAPEEPAPENPAPEEPAPESPAPEEPVPEKPTPEEPAPESPAPEEPAPESPAPEEPAPEEPSPEEPGNDDGRVSENDPSPSPEDGTVDPEDEKEPEGPGTEEEKTLLNVKWKLVRDESAYSRFEALLEGDVFVYEPDLSRYPLKVEAELPRIRVTITAKEGDETVSENETVSEDAVSENAAYPEFSRMMIAGGVRIIVEAPEGVFPEGAEISVKKIDDAASAEKIKNTVGASANVAAFDITVKDVSGNEIQPRTEYGVPRVTFENVNIVKDAAGSENPGVYVYHFEEGLEGGERLEADVNAAAGSASVEAGHFSPFVLVVEGGEEESAGDIPSIPVSEIPQWLVDNGWVKINGVNAGNPRPKGKVFSDILVSVNSISNNTYKAEFKVEGAGPFDRDNAINKTYELGGNDSYSEVLISIKKVSGGGEVANKSWLVYPKYADYNYSISLNKSEPRSVAFDTVSLNRVNHMKKGVNISFDLLDDSKKVSENVTKSDLGSAFYEDYVFYTVDGVERDSDGDYKLPDDPAVPGKDSYLYTEMGPKDTVYEPGIYAAAPRPEISLGRLPEGSASADKKKQKAFENTVSSDAGGLNENWRLPIPDKGTYSGVFFRIETISIDQVVNNKITVSQATLPYEDYMNGYELFEMEASFNPFPDLKDPEENVKYVVTKKGTGTVVKSGLVSDNPLPRLMEVGEYEIKFDATGSKHYRGTYGPVKSLTIMQRDLTDKKYATMTIDPKQFIVKDASSVNPVTAPVRVTWKSPKSGLSMNLVEGTDYVLTYKNNTKPGTATATVSGIGIYKGTISDTFDIIVSSKVPTVLFREELDEGEPSEKQKEWYNTGVKLSGKKEGTITYDARIGTEGEFKSETDPFKKEGEKVSANLYLRSSANPPTYYNVPQFLNIDLTAPTGIITAGGVEYSGLQNDGKIAQYINNEITANGNGSDAISGVAELGYYNTDSPSIKTQANLEQMRDEDWTAFVAGSTLPVIKNKNNFIYLRIKDKAGNMGFASAKGICYDTVAPSLSKVVGTSVNNRMTIDYTASDALSGIGKYYALVRSPSEPEPTAAEIIKGKSSDKQPFDIGNVSGVKVIYCVVADRAGNVSAIKKVSAGSDKHSPTGTIKIMDKTWDSVQSEEKVVAYTREKQNITITGSDPASGVKKIDYYISPKCYTTAASIAAISANLWKTYSDSQKPEIEHNVLNYVYARVSDNSGNLGFISTEGVWHDTIVPKNDKIATSKIKDTSVTVTITGSDGESGVDSYYALVRKADLDAPDNKAVESAGTRSEKTTFEMKGLVATSSYKVYGIVKDKAGNLSEVKSASFSTTKAQGSAASKGASASSKPGSGSKSKSSKDKAKEAADAYKQQNGIISGQGDGRDNVLNSVPIPTRIPYIGDASEGVAKGQELTSGWERIEDEADKAPEPADIHIQMNGATVVPLKMLKTFANRNITMYFVMADDYIWAVNGLSFTAAPSADLDLRIRKDTKNIPSEMVNKTADIYPHTTLSLEHNGDFGCKAILSLPFGTENTGMYANLYYYNEPGARIDFVDSVPVDGNGRSEFEFTHASDYLVVLRGDALTDKTAEMIGATDILPVGGDDSVIMPKSGLTAFFSLENKNFWILMVTILSLALCAAVLFAPDEKKKLQAR